MAQVSLNHFTKFNFIVTLVVPRKLFNYAHSVTELLQAKSNEIVKGSDLIISLNDLFTNVRHDVDDYHKRWKKETLEIAKKVNVVDLVPKICLRQMLREIYPTGSGSEYYKLPLNIPMFDTGLGELKRKS